MLIYSMSVTTDGYVTDRDGGIGWGGVPSDEVFAFHLARVRSLGGYLLGRRLYETMLPWENDPSMKETALTADFAAVWSALPKVVFSRTLDSVQGRARLAEGSLRDELSAVRREGEDVEIGGAELASQAIELGLVDELRLFRVPVVVGGGTPYLPPVAQPIALELVETRAFDTGIVYERYQVTSPGEEPPTT